MAKTTASHSQNRGIANLKPFKKGQSGNPGGRPKKNRDIAAVALEGSEKAIQRLVKLIDSDDDRVALAACQAVLDRAVGKPAQSVKVDANHNHTHHGSEPVSETVEWIRGVLGKRANGSAAQPLPH